MNSLEKIIEAALLYGKEYFSMYDVVPEDKLKNAIDYYVKEIRKL